jgi:hypothetical protein
MSAITSMVKRTKRTPRTMKQLRDGDTVIHDLETNRSVTITDDHMVFFDNGDVSKCYRRSDAIEAAHLYLDQFMTRYVDATPANDDSADMIHAHMMKRPWMPVFATLGLFICIVIICITPYIISQILGLNHIELWKACCGG